LICAFLWNTSEDKANKIRDDDLSPNAINFDVEQLDPCAVPSIRVVSQLPTQILALDVNFQPQPAILTKQSTTYPTTAKMGALKYVEELQKKKQSDMMRFLMRVRVRSLQLIFGELR
jgi:hypothetical protein